MKKFLLAAFLLLLPTAAFAQCNGIFPNNTVCGNITGSNNTPRPTNPSAFQGSAGGTNGQIQYNNNGNLAGTGPLTCPAGQFLNTAAAPFVCGTPNGVITGNSTVTGAATTYTSAQGNTVVKRSNSGSAMSDILPGTSPGILPANTIIYITNSDSAGILSIKAGSGASIKTTAAATGYVYICPGQTISFYSDGSNYFALGVNSLCVFTANTSIFVATTGSNTNDGLTASTPLLTIQAAWNLLQNNFNTAGFTSTISVANGTYTGLTNISGLISGQTFGDTTRNNYTNDTSVFIIGNTTTPSNVVLTSASTLGTINVTNGARVGIAGFRLSNTAGGYGFYVVGGAQLSFSLVDFGGFTSGGIHYAASQGGFIEVYAPYSISGGAGCHFIAGQGGIVQWLATGLTPKAITLTGTPAFTSGFACAQGPGYMSVDIVNTFTGAATGPRYSASLNSVINTAGQGATYFPGNVAGTTSTGGIYN